jgi:hypothetical protein
MSQRTLWLMLAATILCAGCTSSATTPSATTPPSAPALESSRADSTGLRAGSKRWHRPARQAQSVIGIAATTMVRCRSS